MTEVGEIADETLGEEGSEAFRQEVERIRAEGGNAWLTLLNRMHQVQVHKFFYISGMRVFVRGCNVGTDREGMCICVCAEGVM